MSTFDEPDTQIDDTFNCKTPLFATLDVLPYAVVTDPLKDGMVK